MFPLNPKLFFFSKHRTNPEIALNDHSDWRLFMNTDTIYVCQRKFKPVHI